MKNQYYGDNKDLFKFDLIEQIMNSPLGIQNFFYVPMLTPNDDSDHGEDRVRKDASAGYHNDDLLRFLDKPNNQPKNERRVREIKEYFENEKKLAIKFYDHISDNEYFTHRNRKEYFSGVLSGISAKSLVFLDPDTGIEVKKSKDQHILYSELQQVFEILDDLSLLMVIQFFYPGNYHEQVKRRASDLSKITNFLTYIRDNKITFFFLMKKVSVKEGLETILKAYQNNKKGPYSKLSLAF